MAKSRKTTAAKPAPRQTRKTVRKSASSTKPKRRTTTAAAPLPLAARVPAAVVRPSKRAAILALLQRPNGAPISDLTGATGWQAHSVRAALTGLRKEGRELIRDKDAAGITHYRLSA